MKSGLERCKAQEKKKSKKLDTIVRGVLIYWIAFVCVA